MTDSPLRPQVVAANAGDAWWWLNSLAVIKASAASTGGQMAIIEVTEPPGEVAPLHVHHREDEAFWILEGNATFEIGGEVVEAGPGDYLFGPRGVPHRYTVGDAGCRMLFIVTPGGFEQAVMAMSRPAEARALPPPLDQEPDWDHIARVADAHGLELLG